MEPDGILDEVSAFKRRLASVVDRPQVQKPPPATVNRFTELPAHKLRFTGAVEEEYRYPGLPGPSCPVSGTIATNFSGVTAPYTVVNGSGVLTWDAGTSSFLATISGIDYQAICTGGNTWAITASDGAVSVFDGAGLEGSSIANTQIFGGTCVITR